MSNLIQKLNGEMSAVVEMTRRSLVKVGSGRRGGGAGIVIGSDGFILTNAHVVQNETVQVMLSDDRQLSAQIVAADEDLDLALLSVDMQGLPAIPLGDSQSLQPGELVLALGHPWGVSGAASAGPVIAVGQAPELSQRRNEYIQAGLQLRPGHSGGPMVNSLGQLVGVNTMITGPEVGLAVPVQAVKTFINKTLPKSEGLKV